MKPLAGIIANPISARDIRRVISNAAGLQITERANIVLRVLACLAVCGIEDVVMMPDKGGILAQVKRDMDRSVNRGEVQFPRVRYVDMPVTGEVADTHRAAMAMRTEGVSAIVVLGGDGTHRAVVTECGDIPVAGISTGTNNAFPEHREPTITGLAVGLAITGKVPEAIAYAYNKRISVFLNGKRREIALVDAVIVTDRYIGSRALWRTETFRELLVAFASPEAIGMSAVAGLLEPIRRSEPEGLFVELAPIEQAKFSLLVPIAPGYVRPIGVQSWRRIKPNLAVIPVTRQGSIALDGEKELPFSESDYLEIVLEDRAFRTVNVAAIMNYAATNLVMRNDSPEWR